jgi:hypothetical protein
MTRLELTPPTSDFPVTEYDGTKTLLISTRTVMGGRNPFLGIAYVVVGGLCIVLGAVFLATQLVKPRFVSSFHSLSVHPVPYHRATSLHLIRRLKRCT